MMLGEGEILRGRKLDALAASPEVETVELYLHQAVCAQSCQFCAYPLVRARRSSLAARVSAGLRGIGQRATGAVDVLAWLDRIIEIMRTRARGCVLLSGPDCLRHPQIEAILDRLAAAPELAVELLGPLTRLAEPELAARVAALPGLRAIYTSLLSTRAAVHDAIVGAPGAHAELLAALDRCRAHAIPFTINVLVTPTNVAELPELLSLCLELGASNINVSLYHPESASEVLVHASWRELDLSALVASREAVYRAWTACDPAIIPDLHAHYLPRCWVPPKLRDQLLRDAIDPQDNFTYLPACEACSARDRCPGVTVPAAEYLGPAAVKAC